MQRYVGSGSTLSALVYPIKFMLSGTDQHWDVARYDTTSERHTFALLNSNQRYELVGTTTSKDAAELETSIVVQVRIY